MSSDPRRLHDYLEHVCEAIERIQRYTSGLDEPAFLRSEIVQDAGRKRHERQHKSVDIRPRHARA